METIYKEGFLSNNVGLTCCNDVKYTWYSLLANTIRCIAQQCSVIQFCHRCIGYNTRCACSGDMRRRHIDALRRVVESPPELDVGWIGVYLTFNFGFLLFGDAMYPGLVRFARRGDCACVYV